MKNHSENNVIKSTFAADPNFRDLLEEFAGNLSGRIDAMQNAVDQNNLEKLYELAHKIKGAAGFAGYQSLSEIARRIDELIKEKAGIDDITETLEKIRLIAAAVQRGVK